MNKCRCYHRQDLRVNVYDCSHGDRFPVRVPYNTNWLICSNSNISNFPNNIPYLENITKINISSNYLHTIPENILSMDFKELKTLDVSNNRFSSIPKKLEQLDTLEEVYISDNPIYCNCDMLWLISWMNKFLPDGTRIVRDYEKVKCSTGKQIYKLTAVEMGCFPKELTSWQEAILGAGGGIIIIIIVTTIIVAKRWNEVKWFLFFHFNIRDKRDDDVNILVGKKWDAMISYR